MDEVVIYPAVRSAIKMYMSANQLTMKDLARILDVRPQTVSATLKRGFGRNSAKAWAKKFGFNAEFLRTGHGSLMDENNKVDLRMIENSDGEQDRVIGQISGNPVPLIPVFAQAGHLSDFASAINEYDCDKVLSPVKNVDLAVPIYGESMYPDFPNGSIVFVKRIDENAFIEWGKAYILDTVNGPVIKYLAPSERDGFIKCISANHDPRYAPFEVSASDIRAIFKVVMCMSMK